MSRTACSLLLLLAACGGAPSPDDAGSDGGAGGDAGGGGPAWRDAMLVAHNQVRSSASPAPSPALAPLVWSDAAASVAQAWAAGCSFTHNAGRGSYGENIFASSNTSTPSQVVSSWAAETSAYNYAQNTCAGVCGHYTQLVWRGTTAVGCGAATCTGNSPFGGSGSWNFWVCDYSPPGNVNNQRPY